MSRDQNFYLEAKFSGRVRSWLGARTAVLASNPGDDRIVVRRPPPRGRRKMPAWLSRGVLTTLVLATIGFSLQRLAMPSSIGANGSAAAGLWGSKADDVAAAPLTVLTPEQQALQPISREAAIALNNSIPFSAAPVPAATPFVMAGTSEQDRNRAAGCLAQAIYYEAGGDTLDDQRAVAQVILNRVRHPLFPKTVCGVVFQGSQLRTGCQFTFTCDGSMNRIPDAHAWARAQVMAQAALNGAVYAPVGYATHFHTPWVAPYWAPTLEKIVQVGGHLFYRWPGASGSPRAFMARYAGGETAGVASGGLPAADVEPILSEAAAPAPPTEAPVAPQRKIEVAVISQPMATALVSLRTSLVPVPSSIVLAGGPGVAERTYHPPIPRGGSAQPLLSRDR